MSADRRQIDRVGMYVCLYAQQAYDKHILPLVFLSARFFNLTRFAMVSASLMTRARAHTMPPRALFNLVESAQLIYGFSLLHGFPHTRQATSNSIRLNVALFDDIHSSISGLFFFHSFHCFASITTIITLHIIGWEFSYGAQCLAFPSTLTTQAAHVPYALHYSNMII